MNLEHVIVKFLNFWSHIAADLVFVGATATKEAPFVSDWSWLKFGMIVPVVNMHWLTELDLGYEVVLSRWQPWCHFTRHVTNTSLPLVMSLALCVCCSTWSIVHLYFFQNRPTQCHRTTS